MIFDSWFLFLPMTVADFGLWPDSTVATAILKQLSYGRPLFLVLHCALIVVFALFYTAFLLDPEKSSETLKMHGGAIRGIEPGEPSAAYIDHVVSRIAIVGGLYLGLVIMILPHLLISYFAVPFYIGGVSFLVVVCTIMDIGAQYKQQMQLQPGGYSR
jgi:preprotein translocase subunit SecY